MSFKWDSRRSHLLDWISLSLVVFVEEGLAESASVMMRTVREATRSSCYMNPSEISIMFL